jgi:hypothetical protein
LWKFAKGGGIPREGKKVPSKEVRPRQVEQDARRRSTGGMLAESQKIPKLPARIGTRVLDGGMKKVLA